MQYNEGNLKQSPKEYRQIKFFGQPGVLIFRLPLKLKTDNMKKLFFLSVLLSAFTGSAQSTDDLLKQDERKESKEPVMAFSSEKVINANTTEVTGKGKMDFKITHNFSDIAGSVGGIKNFFGLDVTTDVRISFNIGLGKNFDAIISRAKGAGNILRILETGFKWRFMQQTADNSSPVSLALFVNNCVSTMNASGFPTDENYFQDFGDRTSQVFQLIAARKFGRVSLQLNPTFLTQGHVVPNDDKSIFAIGGALRFPVSRRVNIMADYFHAFRSESSENFFATQGVTFYDPLSIGFEILTGGHVFHLNFTNAREILENRFLPRTTTSWGKGQFRWAFNISRTFSLWREKSK
jgi:hypothetical protein